MIRKELETTIHELAYEQTNKTEDRVDTVASLDLQ